ncbi:MAG: M48 family metalloprotease, partial [bacterium]|nr:M48 family metalloprotease [bacterium]
MDPKGYSPDAAARGRRYQMRRLGLGLAAGAVEWALTVVFFLLAARAEGWGLRAAGPFWQGALFFAALATLRGLVSLPLDFRAGFRLSHSAGLSNQTLGGWWSDRLKGWGLQLVLGGVASGGFLALTAWRPEGWWWPAGLLAIGLGLILALLSPVVLAPIFFKFKPLADETLRARLEGLLERTGARVRGGVWEMDMSRRTKGANAALVGWGPSRRVVLADNLVNEYSADEIEAVLAHELAHHAGGHIPQLLAGRAVFLLAGLYVFEAALGVPDLWAWAGGAPEAGMPALIAALWVFLTL